MTGKQFHIFPTPALSRQLRTRLKRNLYLWTHAKTQMVPGGLLFSEGRVGRLFQAPQPFGTGHQQAFDR
ncbi:hypothetical protein KSX_52930 [Ktedonospora formicarum]|uniref:Uncharacterized protein n=1 Tax=Ktedonospora formicarum TaxID=2778364 RepID=A0A8J3I5I3_9CHLR|nr:hypothetical protein KSX_52930 [Ktedonospora formicarum]